ncbi:MAG: hypothetical protein ISF22_09085 [Methanomassiliicoccus sp.]|nr:hypothetical protein [Methanomassiliicoccus sp.]
MMTETEIERVRNWAKQEVARARNKWPELEISSEQLEAIVRFSGASCVYCGQEIDLNDDPMPRLERLDDLEPVTLENIGFAHRDESLCEKPLEEDRLFNI